MPDALWLRIATLCLIALLSIIAIELHRIAELMEREDEP